MDRVTPPGAAIGFARIRRFSDASAVASASAEFIGEKLRNAIAERGRCRLALSGGSTPRATYERLATTDATDRIDWSRVEFFFGDERMVPPSDASSNYRMAREALFDRIAVPERNVHRMLGELSAAEAARRYAIELGDAPLDLVLLGMGDDGHVASLFPGTPALERPEAPVVPNHAPVAPHSRVTLSLPVINAASSVLLMVTGGGKAARLKEVFDQRRSGTPVLPAARVRPAQGECVWHVDEAAAKLLDPELAS